MLLVNNSNFVSGKETAITLGNFDGVHIGHRMLIEAVKKQQGLVPTLITFSPHPMFLFAKKDFVLITTPEEKKSIISDLGIQLMLEYPFTYEFSIKKPEHFAREIIFENLKCKFLAIGEGFRFGKEKRGDYNVLVKIGAEYGADVIKIPKVLYNDEVVSSTSIREKIKSGVEIQLAGQMLSSVYQLNGIVVEGKKIGRTIGFPTLNIDVTFDKILPANGVYITTTEIGSVVHQSITNIGLNPTVNGKKKTIESHVFDFSEDIYGAQVTVHFHKFLRYESKFDGLSQLKEQLSKDKETALKFFYNEKLAMR